MIMILCTFLGIQCVAVFLGGVVGGGKIIFLLLGKYCREGK